MPLSPSRIHQPGQSAYPWEQEAIAWIRAQLPDRDPFHFWPLQDLRDAAGRILQLDGIVLGFHAVYVLEVKGWAGVLEGRDAQHWRVTFPDGRVSYYDNPLFATATKAKAVASLLQKRLPPEARPWVEPLVFLSDPALQVRVPESYLGGVVTATTFLRAITHGEVPQAAARLQSKDRVNRPVVDGVLDALSRSGLLVPSTADLRLGDFKLARVIEDGPGYQDWLAEHDRAREMRRRVRIYLTPPSASPERRAQLRRAAEREARILTALDHPSILRVHDYREEGPTGSPAIAFEHPEGVQTLESLVRLEGDRLTFDERLAILERLAEALHYCHRRKVWHRALCPGSVLVRRDAAGRVEVKLYDFQLASQLDATQGTQDFTAFSTDVSPLYRAPEAFRDPDLASTESADLFSLGAVAYFVLTGQHPAASIVERERILASGGGLSLAAASDAFPAADPAALGDRGRLESLDALLRLATDPNPDTRADDVMGWLGLLLEAATRPEEAPAEETVDPLLAGPDAHLGQGLTVVRALGSGSTAKVLLVRRQDPSERDAAPAPGDKATKAPELALKVALDESLADRIEAEEGALRRVQSDRVVRLEGRLTVGGRSCLLLAYAGETVAQLLQRGGPVGLDYAQRWGEDLLLALGRLEERGVLHKDVKPANLGVTTWESKKARHLFLFDFSLAAADPGRLDAGTPAYRDPFLPSRGCWDEAADRFSAAMTLHELLTGVLPRFEPGERGGGRLAVAAERFDAAPRTRLAAFFARALDPDARKRHGSAAEMRTGWLSCFGPASGVAPVDAAPVSDETLAAIAPDASIEALPLSPAAKNALDRSGVVTVRELVEIPRNEVSGIRGAGRATVREILELTLRYSRLRTLEPALAAPFFPAYRGANGRVVEAVTLSPEAVSALEDAGLGRTFAAAAARRERVERLLSRHAGAAAALRAYLGAESDAAITTPQTVEAFVELFLPSRKKGKALQQVRLFYGLDAREGVRPDDARSVGAALGVDRVSVYVAQNRLRAQWARDAERLEKLTAHLRAALASLGGVAPLARAAEALPAWLPHAAGQEEGEEARRRAEALFRIGTAGEAQGSAALHVERVQGNAWVALSRSSFAAVRRLGEVADALAAQAPLPSPEDARTALRAELSGSDLAALPPERLVPLAAEASEGAAASARLELYPRGLAPERALLLAAGALGSGVRPEEVQRAVSARYPEAAPLPGRPALDALVAALKLRFDDGIGKYLRADLAPTSTATQALPSGGTTTHFAALARPVTAEQMAAAGFEERMHRAVAQGGLRVLDVNRAEAEEAAERLALRLGARLVSLDRALTDRAWVLMAEKRADPQAFVRADRDGPEGPHWHILRSAMSAAARDVARELVARGGAAVLASPGLLARYQLAGFFEELAKGEASGATFLLVNPAQEGATLQPIHGFPATLDAPVPASQHLRIPREWLGPAAPRGV